MHQFFLPAAFCALLGIASAFPFAGKVLNGTEVTPHSLPWVVNIRAATTHGIICTGVIYNELYILTVARCVDTVLPQTLEVVVGEHNINEVDGAEVQVQIAEVLAHELYLEATNYDDIALLKLAEPLTWTPEIQPASFPTVPEEEPSGTCRVAGWGSTTLGSDPSPVLLETVVDIITDGECRESYLGTALLGESMLCAANADHLVPCGDGDDGAPLICGDDNKVVGLYSWAESCGVDMFPPVFTEISFFLDWIDATINGTPENH